ncbi:heptaprenyl diphosphate synthase component 1 [Alkalihalobacillus oceani]|uniref:Heptaprenyl diphosphate synthase component 1 n=1 Tax=Halalkalibacter oceani TaxID=1653776 RepID=A0A9X2INA8_9BACI|nr:heptaprenyl diphosphate synthase component 1 [Halalkalibacter oceani]MCM3713601.1 heptaprenyl diphosphate synthase component 1 [Halalkalibacter oceani]
MATISQFNEVVKEINESFYSLIRHPYLQKYIHEPVVDEDKVRFLYAGLYRHLPAEEAKMFTISSLLVQAALDVHEAVTLHKVTTDAGRKNRQLTILAGDYYSSLYYYLLAENKHLPMVRVFSHSIQEINESKMNLYGSDQLSYHEAMENMALIESLLMQNIVKHFGEDKWAAVMKDYFYLKRLLFEKVEWLEGKTYPVIQAIFQEADGPKEMLELIERKVEDVKDRLLKNSRLLQTCAGFVIEHVDALFEQVAWQEKVAEEG